MSVVSQYRCLNIWPNNGGLNNQDSGLVFWASVLEGMKNEMEIESINKQLSGI